MIPPMTIEALGNVIAIMSHPGEVLTPAVKSAVDLLDLGHTKAARDLLAKALEDSKHENYHKRAKS